MHSGSVSKALFPSSPPRRANKKENQWIKASGISKFASRHHRSGPVWPIHDLWANELLLWVLPTHLLTHLIKFVFGLLVLLAGFLWFTIQRQVEEQTYYGYVLSLFQWCLMGLSIPAWVYWYYHGTLYAHGKPWMDPTLPAVNRMEMHVPLRLFENAEKARRAACLPQLVSRIEDHTPNVLLLDHLDWKFQLLSSVEDALLLVYRDNINGNERWGTDEDGGDWSPIKVPGNWMLQGFDDIPIYTNQKYPFPCQPPIVPRQNPTGVYKLRLSIPTEWYEYPLEEQQLSVLLHGIESACFVFWNGELLGLFKDSRLSSEFAIPTHLLEDEVGDIVLHIVVVRWSDGSYMEDQDHWWMAGIHRSVELIRRRPGADILDYHVSSPASGDLTVSVQLQELPSTPVLASTERIVTARLYADQQLTADGDWKRAKEEIWSQSLNGENSTILQFKGQIPNVQSWTAETPNLYTLVLEQQSNNSVTQVESCRVGFRSIDINEGILHVNGKQIMICGINRHEHDPDHGKVVSIDRMKQDITTLKQNNFNAIRTSHYPAHSSFYRLCDFYGMYVCDEANIETHGMKPMGRLAHDWGWENSFVSRVHRMVQRDLNHPSIIIWSLGNEAGRGRNMVKARKSILDLDTSRPICYESGGSWAEGIGRTELTDIVCPMYPDVNRAVKLADKCDEDRPIALCEYSHSMNNSNGNLHLYWEKFWEIPRLQGGFIWDMIDQGLRKHADNGREYYAYGGDFGDKIHDRQFCINGMFSPEREPHPSVAEIKFLQQPAQIRPRDAENFATLRVTKAKSPLLSLLEGEVAAPIALKVTNRYVFRDLTHVSWKWRLSCSRSRDPILLGEAANVSMLSSLDLSPAIKKVRQLESSQKEGSLLNYFLDIQGVMNCDQTWASAGHIVVVEQIPLRIVFENDQPAPPKSIKLDDTRDDTLVVTSDQDSIKVSNGGNSPFVAIDKLSGGISSIKHSNTELLCGHGLKSNFTRAATDNDRGGLELILDFMLLSWAEPLVHLQGNDNFSYEKHWKRYGLSQDSPPRLDDCSVDVVEAEDDHVRIEAYASVRTTSGKVIFNILTEYEIFRDRRIFLSVSVRPTASIRKIPTLPRIGLSFDLNPSFHKIQYSGRGPHENYPDRKVGAKQGIWKTSPSEMGYSYIVPSENGSRSDCKWISFDSDDGGMVVVADACNSFSCSALLHSAEELHHAQHTCDLDPRKNGVHPIHVNIDHQLLGVGGDVSWFPCVYPEYLVPATREYKYGLWLLPLATGESPVEVASLVNTSF